MLVRGRFGFFLFSSSAQALTEQISGKPRDKKIDSENSVSED